MDRKKATPIILGVLVFVVICAGIISAGYLGYKFFFNSIANNQQEVIRHPSNSKNDQVTEDAPIFPTEEETSTVVIASVDIGDLDELDSLFNAFWESRDLLHETFYLQPIDDSILAQGAIDGLVVYLEEYDISLDSVEVPTDAPTPEDLAEFGDTPDDALEAFLPFWSAYQKALYAERPEEITHTMLMRNALAGMADSLGDIYTGYLDPDMMRDWETHLEGEYEGIGAWVDITTEYLTIIAPMSGSPAEKAGLQAGDQVIAIDGEDMTGIDGDLVRLKILGPAGTDVTLTVIREDVEEPIDIVITRAKIIIPNVEYELLDGNIAYIQLFTFNASAFDDLHSAIEDLLNDDPVGIILDLRGNGGGYLHTAIDVASEFIDEGVILYEEYGDGSRDIHKARPWKGLATDIPLVVLVNEGSASASEIVAGAIQDHERGLLVGTTTFGKGLVQLSQNLPDGQGALKITIAQWLTPNGHFINEVGLEPDFIVEITEDDIEAGIDPQLDKAIEVLLSIIE